MSEFFSNSTFLGIIALLTLIFTIVGVVSGLVAWWRSNRHKKWITVQNMGVVPLDKTFEEFQSINITYKSQDIKLKFSENLTYFDCIIKNEGENDILDSDFQTEFSLKTKARWLEVNATPSNSASNFQSYIEETEDRCKLNIKFSILKPNDTIKIRSLIAISSYDADKFFDNITISDGIKNTVIEKKLLGQTNKNPLDNTGVILTLIMSFYGIILSSAIIVGLMQDNKTNTFEDNVIHYIQKNIDVMENNLEHQYSANIRDDLVFLKLVDSSNTNQVDQNLVLFKKDFENDFKPIIASKYMSNTASNKTINIVSIISFILFLLFIIVFIFSLIFFIVSLYRLAVQYLPNLFFNTW
jgi:hypothetical protein